MLEVTQTDEPVSCIYIYILADIPVVGQNLMFPIDEMHGLCVLLGRVHSECFRLLQSYAP